MIVITVMYGQLMQVRTRELPRTATTDPGIHFERFFAVSLFTLFPQAPGFLDHFVETFTCCRISTAMSGSMSNPSTVWPFVVSTRAK